MSMPTTGESAGSTFAAPSAPAAPVMTRVDWAMVPRVNLLPTEISADRQLRNVQRWLAAAVVATVLLGGAATWYVQRDLDAVRGEVAAAQAITRDLNGQKARYAEVPKTNALIDQAEELRETAMATHVRWYEYLNDLAQATPAEVTLTSVNSAVASSSTGGAPAGSTDPLAPAGVGGITFQATSERYPDVAKWLEAMNGVPGFGNSSISVATYDKEEDKITFAGTVTITGEALSHDYDRKKR
jgi:Tfp pilus assembly protein PilN